jgi:hypothetical protein
MSPQEIRGVSQKQQGINAASKVFCDLPDHFFEGSLGGTAGLRQRMARG